MNHPEWPLLPSGISKESVASNLPWAEQALQHVGNHLGDHVDAQGDPIFQLNEGIIHWPEKANDFEILHIIDELLRKHIHLEAEEIEDLIPVIRKLLLKTQLFSVLHDPSIKVSEAHACETIFNHTLEVFRQALQYDFGRSKEELIKRRALLWMSLDHDSGKIFGAVGKDSQFHAFISTFLLYEFFYQIKDFSPELIQQMLYGIQYHHSFEELAHKWLSKRQMIRRFREDETTHGLFMRLSLADVRSTGQYAEFAEQNINISDLLFPHFSQNGFHARQRQ